MIPLLDVFRSIHLRQHALHLTVYHSLVLAIVKGTVMRVNIEWAVLVCGAIHGWQSTLAVRAILDRSRADFQLSESTYVGSLNLHLLSLLS